LAFDLGAARDHNTDRIDDAELGTPAAAGRGRGTTQETVRLRAESARIRERMDMRKPKLSTITLITVILTVL